MPVIENLATVLPLYQIITGMTVLFAVGAIVALVMAYRAGLFTHNDDIAIRMLDFEDRPLAKPGTRFESIQDAKRSARG